MNTAELTALHTATLAAMNAEARTARTLANITARAETLFNDGYTVDRSNLRGLFYVAGPQGQQYQVEIGTSMGTCCDCPAFGKYDTCKHYLAVEFMLRDEAQAADYDALMGGAETLTGCDAYARF